MQRALPIAGHVTLLIRVHLTVVMKAIFTMEQPNLVKVSNQNEKLIKFKTRIVYNYDYIKKEFVCW